MRYLILVLLIPVLAGCETVYVGQPPGPPPHATAHGYYKTHVYHYYPDLEIYWSANLGTYTVFSGGQWVVVHERPAVVTRRHRHVVIHTDAREPWRNHSYYKAQCPPRKARKRD